MSLEDQSLPPLPQHLAIKLGCRSKKTGKLYLPPAPGQWLRYFAQVERHTIGTELSPKELTFLEQSVEKVKPEGALKNNEI